MVEHQREYDQVLRRLSLDCHVCPAASRSHCVPSHHLESLQRYFLAKTAVFLIVYGARCDAGILGDPAKVALKDSEFHRRLSEATHNPLLVLLLDTIQQMMLEERRVGKECRSRWWPYH